MSESKIIKLNTGETALVSKEDYDRVAARRWTRKLGKDTETIYAVSYTKIRTRKYQRISLHRFILGINDPAVHVDHINGNGLDNRRENIRIATKQQNVWNSKKHSNGATPFIGVTDRGYGYPKFRARIVINGKRVHLGDFDTAEAAAKAYNEAAIKARGEFARLNRVK